MILSRRTSVAAVAALLGLAALPAAAQVSPAAQAIHDRVLVLDSHTDILLPDTPRRYYGPDGASRTTLDKLTRGGVDALVLSLAVGPGPETPEGTAAARKDVEAKLALARKFIADSQGRAVLARTADEVEAAHKAGKVAVILGFQNARSLGADLSAFDPLYQAGVRLAGLNHAGHNAFSDSSRPTDGAVERHGGLSPLGVQAVKRFNDLGVLVDVSQLSTNALLQTLKVTRAPVVASHSNVRALVDNTRNLTDAELDAIKANGGVVLLTPFNGYLLPPSAEAEARARALRAEFGLPAQSKSPLDGVAELPAEKRERFYDATSALQPRASVKDYVDHIEYVIKRIGAAHVGVGTDFDHGAGINGFDNAAEAPNVTAELVSRGYGEADITAIWGGNFLRALRAAQAAARP